MAVFDIQEIKTLHGAPDLDFSLDVSYEHPSNLLVHRLNCYSADPEFCKKQLGSITYIHQATHPTHPSSAIQLVNSSMCLVFLQYKTLMFRCLFGVRHVIVLASKRLTWPEFNGGSGRFFATFAGPVALKRRSPILQY